MPPNGIVRIAAIACSRSGPPERRGGGARDVRSGAGSPLGGSGVTVVDSVGPP